jgi:hypothetical protein
VLVSLELHNNEILIKGEYSTEEENNDKTIDKILSRMKKSWLKV